jgi:hypothetical protein
MSLWWIEMRFYVIPLVAVGAGIALAFLVWKMITR